MTVDRPPPAKMRFAWHFVLLCCAVALLAGAGSRGRPEHAVAVFGWYGALHATLFVLSLRDWRGTRLAWLRTLSFVGLTAALAMASAALTLWCARELPALSVTLRGGDGLAGSAGVGLVVALCSAFGAMTYSLLIRSWWIPDISFGSILAITSACLLATLLAIWMGVLFWTNGRLWFTVFWWFALSAGLWVEDFRRSIACRAARG